jgi:hypothetical protein
MSRFRNQSNVEAPALLAACKARLEQHLVAVAPAQPRDEALPARRRDPEPERPLRLARDAPALQVRTRRGADLGVAKPLLVRGRGGVQRLEDPRALAALAGAALGHGDAGAARQQLDRLEEAHLLRLLHELEHVTTHLAREAVVELPLGIDRERRCLLFVERAATHEVPAHAPERHALADQLHDVGRRAHALDPVVGASRAVRPAARAHAAAAALVRPARSHAGARRVRGHHRSLATVTPRPPS